MLSWHTYFSRYGWRGVGENKEIDKNLWNPEVTFLHRRQCTQNCIPSLKKGTFNSSGFPSREGLISSARDVCLEATINKDSENKTKQAQHVFLAILCFSFQTYAQHYYFQSVFQINARQQPHPDPPHPSLPACVPVGLILCLSICLPAFRAFHYSHSDPSGKHKVREALSFVGHLLGAVEHI